MRICTASVCYEKTSFSLCLNRKFCEILFLKCNKKDWGQVTHLYASLRLYLLLENITFVIRAEVLHFPTGMHVRKAKTPRSAHPGSPTSLCRWLAYRVATHSGKQGNQGKWWKKKSLQGKIREFEILLKIRGKSGNFKKSYLCKVKIFKFYSCLDVATGGFFLPYA